jgi:hypothetical protein
MSNDDAIDVKIFNGWTNLCMSSLGQVKLLNEILFRTKLRPTRPMFGTKKVKIS